MVSTLRLNDDCRQLTVCCIGLKLIILGTYYTHTSYFINSLSSSSTGSSLPSPVETNHVHICLE